MLQSVLLEPFCENHWSICCLWRRGCGGVIKYGGALILFMMCYDEFSSCACCAPTDPDDFIVDEEGNSISKGKKKKKHKFHDDA